MSVLGISAFFHDSAAAVVGSDGNIFAAAQEERFTRVKGDSSFPESAIRFCAAQASAAGEPVDAIVFYEDPLRKFERVLQGVNSGTRLRDPAGLAAGNWLAKDLKRYSSFGQDVEELLGYEVDPQRIRFSNHHLSHAASAFYPSPFEEAAVVVIDGVGEDVCTSVWDASESGLKRVSAQEFPNSLGLFYSAMTSFLGFRVNSGEYKVMGLAPFGEPAYLDTLRPAFIEFDSTGQVQLGREIFGHFDDFSKFELALTETIGLRRRSPTEPLKREHADLAASLQRILEEAVRAVVADSLRLTGRKNLCMAGGVALNAVSNGKVAAMPELADGDLWIQPAAGDAGAALGAACVGSELLNLSRVPPRPTRSDRRDLMKGSLLGPQYSNEDIEAELRDLGATFHKLEQGSSPLVVANLLSEGSIVGWHQGRSEFGPRALGSRSILCDARQADAHQVLNRAIKKREPFRPFAPAILEEYFDKWFDGVASLYMLQVNGLRHSKRADAGETQAFFGPDGALKSGLVGNSLIPAATHVDFSARPQAVGRESSQLFRALLSEFHALTGCPVLLNTSFNVRGEPIVERPTEAVAGLVTTNMDFLCIGDYLLARSDQSPSLADMLVQIFPED